MTEEGFLPDDQDEAEGHILSEELIEEFLDYCDMVPRPSARLSFNTKISHLIREQRREALEEFKSFLNFKEGNEPDEDEDDWEFGL